MGKSSAATAARGCVCVRTQETAFVEVTGRKNMGCVVWAFGWDDSSVIMKVRHSHSHRHSHRYTGAVADSSAMRHAAV